MNRVWKLDTWEEVYEWITKECYQDTKEIVKFAFEIGSATGKELERERMLKLLEKA